MSTHPSRFPGVSNDPDKHILTARQANRLAALTHVGPNELTGKTTAELGNRLRAVIDPKLLLFRRICGQVVKANPGAVDLPVPFATVNVYDVDLRLLAWSPPGLPYTWFFPFFWRREKLATVTTDECGRFCVWVPRFDIDFYLRWRLERRCYLEWLRKPTLDDLLRYRELLPPIPQPEPGPLRPKIGPRPIELGKLMTHASKLLDPAAAAKLHEAVSDVRPGSLLSEADARLAQPAFREAVTPPDMSKVRELLEPAMRAKLAARVGVPPQMLEKLDPSRVFGPFLRCKLVFVPEWTAVLDIPDLTFEVTQDIDGDGQQEIIYREGLFDVRWDAGSIADVKLHVQANAITGPSCELPDPGPCGDPSILFAGNYPLQATSAISPYHDATTGYAKLPNRPDADGVPGGTRIAPASTPMLGNFYLMGCAEKAGATHYRVQHEVSGSTGYLNGSYGPLLKVVGGVLQQRLVSPVDGQWYPIVARAEGWTPVGILAPVNASGTNKHTFRLELGQLAGATINPVAGSLTNPVAIQIDTTAPVVTITDLAWRQPDTSLSWAPLDPFNCAVMTRANSGRVQIRLGFAVTANHLRHFEVTGSGCGPIAAPELITDARDGLPAATADAAAHWHTSATDNSATRVLYYELDAGAPAGCYSFAIKAGSRAFNPNAAMTGPDPVVAWTIDPMPVWIQPVVNVALQ
jgi:hypothetical protein